MKKTATLKRAIKKVNSKTNKIAFMQKIQNAVKKPFTMFWNWIKSLNVVGLLNLTLLVIIICLFTSLIFQFVGCNSNCSQSNKTTVTTTQKIANNIDNRKVVKRKIYSINTQLPLKVNKQTNIKPQIKVVGVKHPVIVKQTSLPASVLPKQKLYGDVIVDNYKQSVVLSNGVNIDGNLFIQNIRKYTLPCNARIDGNLFIRNVERLHFCGKFSISGNIYVNRQSSFGPLPKNAHIGGKIIL